LASGDNQILGLNILGFQLLPDFISSVNPTNSRYRGIFKFSPDKGVVALLTELESLSL